MATRDDVWQIITILDEEGFGALAGELLTQINLGREIEIESEAGPIRVPIDEEEQLTEAIHFLRLRLVQPAIVFAEAERIAGTLLARSTGADTESRVGGTVPVSPAVRINFINPDEYVDTGPTDRLPGDATAAKALDDFLKQLPNRIYPTTPSE